MLRRGGGNSTGIYDGVVYYATTRQATQHFRSPSRWLGGVEATGNSMQQIPQFSLNHPTKNSLNFCRPSMGGEFLLLCSYGGLWGYCYRELVTSVQWWLRLSKPPVPTLSHQPFRFPSRWLSGAEATKNSGRESSRTGVNTVDEKSISRMEYFCANLNLNTV